MRVLILGTVRPAHVLLKEIGHNIVLFMSRKTAIATDLGFGYEAVFYFDTEATDQQYVDQALALHKHQPIEAVCCFNDDVQLAGIKIARALNISFPIDEVVLENVTNKSKTREVLHEYGVDDTAYRVANTQNDIIEFIGRQGFPIIAKPLALSGSTGVLKLSSQKDVSLIEENALDFPLLLEDFLEGEEFSVEALSENGDHRIVAIAKKYKDEISFVETGHLVPAPLEEKPRREIESFVLSVISGVGIKNGASHTEIMLTSKGPRLIETHTRLGGDRIFELIRLATGVDILSLTVRQSLGESILQDYDRITQYSKFAAVRFAMPSSSGQLKITGIENVAEVEALPNVTALVVTKKVGDILGSATNSFERAAFCITLGESPEQVLSDAANAIGMLRFNLVWQQT